MVGGSFGQWWSVVGYFLGKWSVVSGAWSVVGGGCHCGRWFCTSPFCKLQEQFPRVWDNFAPPRKFKHHVLPLGEEFVLKSDEDLFL